MWRSSTVSSTNLSMVMLHNEHNEYSEISLGYDSGVSSTAQSFKASSTEEEPKVTVRKRPGYDAGLHADHHHDSLHADHHPGPGRPVSWHGSRTLRGYSRNASLVMQDSNVLPRDRGRLTRDKCVMSRDSSDDRVRPYDADDETEIPVMTGVRRQRPTSLHGVTSLYRHQDIWERDRYYNTQLQSYQRKYEKRVQRSVNGRRRAIKYCDLKRKIPLGYISNSDVPRPYQSSEAGMTSELHDSHPLYHVKRRRSEDMVEADNLNNEASLRLRESKDIMVGRVMQVYMIQIHYVL